MASANNEKIKKAREELEKLRGDKELMHKILLQELAEMDEKSGLTNRYKGRYKKRCKRRGKQKSKRNSPKDARKRNGDRINFRDNRTFTRGN